MYFLSPRLTRLGSNSFFGCNRGLPTGRFAKKDWGGTSLPSLTRGAKEIDVRIFAASASARFATLNLLFVSREGKMIDGVLKKASRWEREPCAGTGLGWLLTTALWIGETFCSPSLRSLPGFKDPLISFMYSIRYCQATLTCTIPSVWAVTKRRRPARLPLLKGH